MKSLHIDQLVEYVQTTAYNCIVSYNFFYFRNNFLDQRKTKLPSIIEDKCPISIPVILLMDNINLYSEENVISGSQNQWAPICGISQSEVEERSFQIYQR